MVSPMKKNMSCRKKKPRSTDRKKKKKELKELKVTTDEHFIHTPKKKKKDF